MASPAALAEMNVRKCLDWRTLPVAHIGIKKKFGGLANRERPNSELALNLDRE